MNAFAWCAVVLTGLAVIWTWAVLVPEDQGESKLERVVAAIERIAEAYDEVVRRGRYDRR